MKNVMVQFHEHRGTIGCNPGCKPGYHNGNQLFSSLTRSRDWKGVL